MTEPLEGKIFGKWQVIEKNRMDNTKKNSMFLCKCVCGKEKVVSRTSLISGDSKSCGCQRNLDTKSKILSNIEVNENGCWNWKGKLTKDGYARIHTLGKYMPVHRASYIFFKGFISDDKLACHTCDNKKCVNPEHIYAGSHKDNAIDAVKRNRVFYHRGESHHSHKYTEKQVKEFREQYHENQSILSYAKNKNIPYVTMMKILRRETWNHI